MASPRWPIPCVCLVTDRRRVDPDARTLRDEIVALERLIDDAIAAGVDAIQIRERDLDAGVLRDLVRRLVRRAAVSPCRVLVNDRPDVAAAAGAHGVHLPSSGLPVQLTRTLGPAWLIGRSIHAPGEAAAAAAAGADYLLFGTVFASRSKPEGHGVAALEGLRAAIVAAAGAPVLAIGGVTPARARGCIEAGAAGVAAIEAFLPEGRSPGALGARRAARELRAAVVADARG